jgi:hypothetical protein
VLVIWKAHINVQYVTTAGLTKYVSKYVTKTEPKSVVSIEQGEGRVKSHLEARRLGAMEIMCLLNSKPILKMSSGVQFLVNSMPEHRTLTVRRVHEIERNPENPYYPDSIEKYFSRPEDPIFVNLVYPDYFSMFVVQRQKRKSQNEGELVEGRVHWRDLLGNHVYRRRKAQITRSPFRRLADGEPFFYAMLLEKRPWRGEEEILGAYGSYRDQFMALFPEEYEAVLRQQQLGRHESELRLSEAYEEIVMALIESINVDVQEIVATQLRSLSPRRCGSMNMIMNGGGDEYDAVLHMGPDQYEVYSIVMNAVNRRRVGTNMTRLFFVTGSAGTGKSFVLSAVVRSLEGRGIKFLKMAPTGIAAIHIGGQTIHSALGITSHGGGNKSTSFVTSMHQSAEKVEELRKVEVIFIDELSMVSSELLNFVSVQFQRLHSDSARPFGGLIVVAFGDLLQLPPVNGLPVYRSYLWNQFFPLVLTVCRRQGEDLEFVKMLNEVRIGKISDESWALLERLYHEFTLSERMWQSTFIVSRRQTASSINDAVSRSLSLDPMICRAIDREGFRVVDISETQKSFKHYTNLPEELNVAVGGRVMFLDNSLIQRGISNGTIGVVTEIKEMGDEIFPIVAFPTLNAVEVNRHICRGFF